MSQAQSRFIFPAIADHKAQERFVIEAYRTDKRTKLSGNLSWKGHIHLLVSQRLDMVSFLRRNMIRNQLICGMPSRRIDSVQICGFH